MNPAAHGNEKVYDLEERTFQFARCVRALVKLLPRNVCNAEDGRQLVRSSGSVGANYIEANETVGKKDFAFRVRIARKEAKESRHWLRLLDTGGSAGVERERDALIQETAELIRIFSAIILKFQSRDRG